MGTIVDLTRVTMADTEFQTGYVSGQLSQVVAQLADLKSGQVSNHKENSEKIDQILTDVSDMKHMVKSHDLWIELTGKPIAKKAERLKYWLMGSVGTTGLAVTSPSWFTKVIAILGMHAP